MDHPTLPAYRRIRGGASYYRIVAVDHFEELQRIGSRWMFHEVKASAYPERLRIQEMLSCASPFEGSNEAEWARAFAEQG
jgi:hypothetical protein